MNNRGQVIGFALFLAWFVFILVLFVTIDPFKESLDTIRGTSSLNCPGTPGFNQTTFDLDESNELNKLTRRPTCFVTGISMIYYVFSFLIASTSWLALNFVKKKRRVR